MSEPGAIVTDEHRETYARDGVVLVRGALDSYWVDLLSQGMKRLSQMPVDQMYALPESFLEADPLLHHEIDAIRSSNADQRRKYTEQSAGFLRYKYMFWWAEEFRQFVLESPAASVVAAVIGASTLRFFVDALFIKEAACETKTYWHADEPAWPVTGEQVPTMWMPLLPVDAKLSSLEYIPGSHRVHQNPRPWPNTFNAKRHQRPDDRAEFYDWEQRREDGETTFVAYDMQPGDVVILHPNMQHGGGANRHPTQPRIAYSTRWFGDDVRWDPRPECVNTPGKPLQSMRAGERVVDDDIFPCLVTQACDQQQAV